MNHLPNLQRALAGWHWSSRTLDFASALAEHWQVDLPWERWVASLDEFEIEHGLPRPALVEPDEEPEEEPPASGVWERA